MIKINAAGWDRALRTMIGLVLLYVGWVGVLAAWLTAVLMVVGGILLVTGVIGWCPLYSLLGISTYHRSPPGSRYIRGRLSSSGR